jgi:hypothetical protein
MPAEVTSEFIDAKIRALVARSRRLTSLTPRRIGIPGRFSAFAPTPAHFAAANRRLGAIDKRINRQH